MRNCIVTLTGKKGFGKTTLLRQLVAPCRRVLIADPEGKWTYSPQAPVVTTPVALMEALGDLGATDPALPWTLVYRDDAERMKIAAPALSYVVRNLTLVVDEWAWLCNAWQLPPWLRRLLQFGRERRVNLLGTTREPQEIHDLLFSQADLFYLFHTDPGNGLDRLRRRYPALASKAPDLGLHEHLVYGDRGALSLLGREGLALPL